jgi:membrane protease YdiL (CAAX protease family)
VVIAAACPFGANFLLGYFLDSPVLDPPDLASSRRVERIAVHPNPPSLRIYGIVAGSWGVNPIKIAIDKRVITPSKAVNDMPVIASRILWIIWSVFLGYFIALVAQAVWSGLLVINLTLSPVVPWSVVVMALLLWPIWLYLGGRWRPQSTSAARRLYLRANPVSWRVFAWAFLAGALSITAIVGYWVVMASLVRMPGSVLPNLSGFPVLTVVLAVGMGSLISPILEQAGFWGYCQVMLEQKFPVVVAVLITSIAYSFGPHPPNGSPLWSRFVLYFLTGLTFSLLSTLTNSNLPGLVVHILGILVFFVLLWPNDPARPLVSAGGAGLGFWLSLLLAVVFTGLAFLAFKRLAGIARSEKG